MLLTISPSFTAIRGPHHVEQLIRSLHRLEFRRAEVSLLIRSVEGSPTLLLECPETLASAAYIRLLLDGMPQRTFSMTTIAARAIPHAKANAIRATMQRVSRDRYSRPLKQVEQEIRNAYSV